MTDQQTTPDVGTISSDTAANQALPRSSAATVTTTGAAPSATQSATPSATLAKRADQKRATPWFRQRRVTLPSAGLLLVGIIVASTGGKDSGIFRLTSSSPSRSGSTVTALPATATIGQSVRDGAFAFTVGAVQPPVKTFMDRFGATQTAEGMFLIVRVNVTNIGYEPRSLTATDQFLANDKDQRFATSSAISSLAGAEAIFSEKINPGHTVNNAPLLFDVPPGTTIASVELHDSLASTGVRVKLS
jgi:hypothetical protein